MPRSSQYIHYMQRIDITGQNVIDIEERFDGLLYEKAENMYSIGKAKNIYTEDYADSDKVRYYLPAQDADYANESTTINMYFLIVGNDEQRRRILQDFLDYIRVGVHRYWDTARNREFDFVVQDGITVSDERWHGSNPYVEVQIPMKNLNGKTKLRT